MTLEQNVRETNSVLVAIKDKIVECGVEVAEGTHAREYATKVKAVYEAGSKEVWDAILDKGKRTQGGGLFSRWQSEYIRPPYVFAPTSNGCDSMFIENNLLKIVEKKYFDLSNLNTDTTASYMCNGCIALEIFEDIGLPAIAGYSRTWRGCIKLHTLEVVRSRAETTYGLTFDNCSALVNITFEGVIAQNGLNLQHSSLLSKASITSVINALSTTTSGLTVTLSETAVISAFGGTDNAEWLALTDTKKNWTINLVKG